ncbi:MAG TPA: putative metal-binding motif-containing protein [Sandaracinaceae bacterium LLY-WYZ-13_1]|nr:putative metal-binding motif-containing protein [Sandaracinaceae bacterium LLY-WYZ-13_1]
MDASADGGATTLCARDQDCADDDFCTDHRCMPGATGADARGCVAVDGPCSEGETCSSDEMRCIPVDCTDPDRDGDGHDAVACGGDDCDDDDPLRYPGNEEVCDADGRDEDCVDTTFAGAEGDTDGDGFVSDECCNADACGGDCDDEDALVHPDASESCNGVDDDCSGSEDDAPPEMPLCPGGTCVSSRCMFTSWDRIFGGSGNDGAQALAVDDAGNLYLAGEIYPDADFGRGAEPRPVVASYDAGGVLRWVAQYDGPGSLFGVGLAFDPVTARVLLLADYSGAIRFGGVDLDSSIDGGALLAGMDPDGSVAWIRRLPALEGVSDRAGGVSAQAGRVVVSSGFRGTFDFGDGAESAVGDVDGYAAEYATATGDLDRFYSLGDTGADVRFVAVDLAASGEVRLGGVFSGSVDVGTETYTGSPQGLLVVSLDSVGAPDWAVAHDSDGFDSVLVIGRGSSQVYVAGRIGGSVDLGGGAVGDTGGAGYLLALDSSDGSYVWNVVMEGSPAASDGFVRPLAMTVSTEGDVRLTGGFRGSVTFPGAGARTADGLSDIFVVEYSRDRLHLRDRAFGEEGIQTAEALVVGPGGAVTVAGTFGGSIDFGSGTRTITGGSWGFVARLPD